MTREEKEVVGNDDLVEIFAFEVRSAISGGATGELIHL